MPARAHRGPASSVAAWWRLPQATILRELHARPEGLTHAQAAARLRRDGPNRLATSERPSVVRSIAKRLANPLIVVLLCASAIAAFTGEPVSFGFIVVIVLMSIALDMVQEHRAVEVLWKRLEPAVNSVAAGHTPAVDAVVLEAIVQHFFAHVHFEEHDFLPLAQKILSRHSSEMAALGVALHMRHGNHEHEG